MMPSANVFKEDGSAVCAEILFGKCEQEMVNSSYLQGDGWGSQEEGTFFILNFSIVFVFITTSDTTFAFKK